MVSGTGASAGIGIGRVVILKEETLEIKRETIADAEAEKARFKKAVEKSIEDTKALADDMAQRIGEKEAEILNGHLMLLQDPMMTMEIEGKIDGEKLCSEAAVEDVCTMYADMFASMDDELMQRERQICAILRRGCRKSFSGFSLWTCLHFRPEAFWFQRI